MRRLADLDAISPPNPDPGAARYSRLAGEPGLAAPPPRLRGIGLGFVAGVATVLALLVFATGSIQPEVWLTRAESGVRHLEDTLVESQEPAATPTVSASASPALSLPSSPTLSPQQSGSRPEPRAPAPAVAPSPSVGDVSHEESSTVAAQPSPVPSPSPSPSEDGHSSSSSGSDGDPSPSPSPSPSEH